MFAILMTLLLNAATAAPSIEMDMSSYQSIYNINQSSYVVGLQILTFDIENREYILANNVKIYFYLDSVGNIAPEMLIATMSSLRTLNIGTLSIPNSPTDDSLEVMTGWSLQGGKQCCQ